MNPIQLIKNFMLNGGTPQGLLMKAIGGNNSNPMINNLFKMAKNGNQQGIENFARNYFSERGLDFDKEFSSFMQNFKR